MAALDDARSLIEQGVSVSDHHNPWVATILAASPLDIARLYVAAGMPAPERRDVSETMTGGHRGRVPNRLHLLLLEARGCPQSVPTLATALRIPNARVPVAVHRLRSRGVRVLSVQHGGHAMYAIDPDFLTQTERNTR
jgi:biotin operon repressor